LKKEKAAMDKVRIGVIGGSGIYEVAQLVDAHEVPLDTPFGKPSDAYIVGRIDGELVAFLPRHGRGHRVSPTRLNSRANIYGFKKLGVDYLISISACGSLQAQYRPGDIVIPDQVFDLTHFRPSSFFDDPTVGTGGLVAHVSVADPFCSFLSEICADAVRSTGNPVHRGGTVLTVEGPRFSTRAESSIFRQLGFAIIGMTAVPEVFLAREAGISYAAMAHVTDYDVWHETEEPVTVAMLIENLMANAALTKQALTYLAPLVARKAERKCKCASALSTAIITRPDLIPQQARQDLRLLIGKYVK
jgi:5'-methylthioadenosine phosphorylase